MLFIYFNKILIMLLIIDREKKKIIYFSFKKQISLVVYKTALKEVAANVPLLYTSSFYST